MPNFRRFRTLPALIAAAALVAFVGCGGDDDKKSSSTADTSTQTTPATTGGTTTDTGTPPSSSDPAVKAYADGFKEVATTFNEQVQQESVKLQTSVKPSEKLQALAGLKSAVDDAATGFAALEPPEAVKADHASLVEGLRSFGSDLGVIADSLKSGDTAAAVEASKRIQDRQAKINATLVSIQSKVGQ